jgi:hypothetical protein
MNEIENQLRQARLAAPSGDLDRRMTEAFRAAARGRPPVWRLLQPWILVPGALALCLAVVLVLPRVRTGSAEARQGDPMILHREDSSTQLVRLLLEPASRQRPLPSVSVSISVR